MGGEQVGLVEYLKSLSFVWPDISLDAMIVESGMTHLCEQSSVDFSLDWSAWSLINLFLILVVIVDRWDEFSAGRTK